MGNIEEIFELVSDYIEMIESPYIISEKDEKQLELKLKESGIEILGEGAGRIVFAYKNFAIKFPKSEDGELQSMNEYYIFKNENLDILNQCYEMKSPYQDIGVQLIVKPIENNNDKYKSIFDWLESNNYSNIVDKIKEEVDYLINKYSLLKEDVIKISSWGIYDNKPKLFDYGCTEELYYNYYE